MRAGIKTGSGANIISRQHGDDDRDSQAVNTYHDGKGRLGQTVGSNAADELWADPIADGKQEHQKEKPTSHSAK